MMVATVEEIEIPRKRFSFRGFFAMTLEWIPGVGVALAGSFLSMWRSNAVMEEKVSTMRTELSRHESENDEERERTVVELKDAYERMHNMFTQIQVMGTEQVAFMRICTKTLDGLSKKLEFHDTVLMHLGTDVEVLKKTVNGK